MIFTFVQFFLYIPSAQFFYSVNRKEKVINPVIQTVMFLGSKVRLVRGADNLTAICEPIV
jgi:hypothetical protein